MGRAAASTDVQERADGTAPEPAWDVARLFPPQGFWSEEEYLSLPTNHLVEFSDGRIEVLPMPNPPHQLIVRFLYDVLSAFARAHALGQVLFAPFPVRLWPGKYREPDLAFLRTEHRDRILSDCWEGADIVMEVVSESNCDHDLVTKRREYAQAGIPEYWMVDPGEEAVTVLLLEGDGYETHGTFGRGTKATSALLPGFAVSVDDVLDAPSAPA